MTLASDLKQTGVKEIPKTKKTVRPPVVGRSTNTKLKSVTTVREVNIFVLRLHPLTAANDYMNVYLRLLVVSRLNQLPVTS